MLNWSVLVLCTPNCGIIGLLVERFVGMVGSTR